MFGLVSLQSSTSFQWAQWQSAGGQGQASGGEFHSRSEAQVRVFQGASEQGIGRSESPQSLIEKALSRAYTRLAGEFEMPANDRASLQEFQPLSANQVASNILGFIEHRLAQDKADGASEEQLESRLEAGLKGFQQGFSEAETQLEALGMLNNVVAEGIAETYDLVTQGISDLRERFLGEKEAPSFRDAIESDAGAVADTAKALGLGGIEAANNTAYDFAQKNSFSFSLVTADGDKVKISASATEAYVSRYSDSAEGQRFAASSSSSQRFSLSVKGELDEDELAAINDLLGQVNDLSEDFFAGDLDKAFQEALDIGYDASEISSFALRLTHTEVQRFASAYDVGEGDTLSERLKPIGQFAQQAMSAIEQIAEMSQADSLMAELLQSISEQQGQMNTRLADFVESLKEHLPA